MSRTVGSAVPSFSPIPVKLRVISEFFMRSDIAATHVCWLAVE